jgi:NAD(P)-dependent dehydrogenase (short-subunit alcohol dehydrogenase family)
MDKPLAGRIAVVTGASRGIGRAAALALAEAGAHIGALARTQGALEELDDAIRACGGAATLVPLDLKDLDALDRLGPALHERWGKLDILLGNAGILGELAPITHIDPPVWDAAMAINVTANWRLIRTLDPLLRASDAGRAIFCVLLRRPQVHGLLGPVLDLQGRARSTGAHLRRRNRLDAGARHASQSRSAAHRHAPRRHAGRGPDDAQDARGPRPAHRPPRFAGLE